MPDIPQIKMISMKDLALILGVIATASTIIYSSFSFAGDIVSGIAQKKAEEVVKPLKDQQLTAQQLNVLMMQSVLQLNTRIVDTEVEHIKEKEKEKPLTDYEKIKLQSLIQEKTKIEADKLKVLELSKAVNKVDD